MRSPYIFIYHFLGGLNGLDDRNRIYGLAKTALGIS